MSLFDKIYKRLFPSNKDIGIQEILRRQEKFLKSYQYWLNSPQISALKKDLSLSWSYQLSGIKPPVDVVIYTSDHANGFMVFPFYQERRIPLSFLMEYIKDRLLTIRYRVVHAVRTIAEKGPAVETLEKYHLKPSFSIGLPVDQIYGNVHLELMIHDEEEVRLKVLVTVYSDRNYNKPRHFDDFVSFLFDN